MSHRRTRVVVLALFLSWLVLALGCQDVARISLGSDLPRGSETSDGAVTQDASMRATDAGEHEDDQDPGEQDNGSDKQHGQNDGSGM